MPRRTPAHLCRHCQSRQGTRPRQLCWSCYYALGVRRLYPSADGGKHTTQGPGNFYGDGSPTLPTKALPGTEAKIQVLTERVQKGQRLWHPLDARG